MSQIDQYQTQNVKKLIAPRENYIHVIKIEITDCMDLKNCSEKLFGEKYLKRFSKR